jgi:hypothetical protein
VKIRGASLLREAFPDIAWRRSVDVRRELIAGLTGALLVVPQAITFAYLAGVQPVYGLYCAVFVGFLSSLFGNSPMVGGPNTAVSILLGLTAIQFAGSGSPLYIEFVLVLSLLIGLIQLVIWLLRGAVLFRYFSPAAISGIKAGIGVLLITSALEGGIGLAPLPTQPSSEILSRVYIVGSTGEPIRRSYQRSHDCVRTTPKKTLAANLHHCRDRGRKRNGRSDLRGRRTGGRAGGIAGPRELSSVPIRGASHRAATLAVS